MRRSGDGGGIVLAFLHPGIEGGLLFERRRKQSGYISGLQGGTSVSEYQQTQTGNQYRREDDKHQRQFWDDAQAQFHGDSDLSLRAERSNLLAERGDCFVAKNAPRNDISKMEKPINSNTAGSPVSSVRMRKRAVRASTAWAARVSGVKTLSHLLNSATCSSVTGSIKELGA